MPQRFRVLFAAFALFALAAHAHAQASATADARFKLSVFGGVSGVKTGYDDGKNLSVTAGFDFDFWHNRGNQFVAEYRGTIPVDKGNVNSEKSQMVGIQVAHPFGRIRPYGDFLFGRGEISYAPPGARVPNSFVFYTLSSSNIFSPGGGFDIRLTRSFSLKADAQYQHYDTPVTTSGHLYSTVGTVGVVYNIHFKPYR